MISAESIGQLVHLIGDVNRTLSSLYTTLQPDFIASNFLRDMVYSNSMVWVKESPKYAIQYNMNFAKLPIVRMVMLLDKYCRGTLDMNDEIEKCLSVHDERWRDRIFKNGRH